MNRLYVITITIIVVIIAGYFLSRTMKKSYKIALVGDSMIDTMRTNAPFLHEALKDMYPRTEFKIYNYGVGAQNVEQGLHRFDHEFSYKDRNYPSVSQLRPDVIILGSWAYNPFYPYDLKKYRTNLRKAADSAKAASDNVYMLIEIAPLQKGFGDGVLGVNWSEKDAKAQADKINDQINIARQIAAEKNIAIIDANTPSRSGDSLYGKSIYVNQTDGIHPSPSGHWLTAQAIVNRVAFSDTLIAKLSKKLFGNKNNPVGELETSPDYTVMQNMARVNSLTTGTTLIRAAELDKRLQNKEEFTVLLPDNNAFEQLPAQTFTNLINAPVRDELVDIASVHILPGIYSAADLQKKTQVTTINGKQLDTSKLAFTNKEIRSSNGVIYVLKLDKTALPRPTLANTLIFWYNSSSAY